LKIGPLSLLQLVKWHGIHPHCYAQTTLRSTGFLTRRMLTHCKSVCRSALMKFSPEWCPTGCNLILSRPRCSGVHPLDVSIRSRLVLFMLVTHLCFQYSSRPWGLRWRRYHHECSRHCNG